VVKNQLLFLKEQPQFPISRTLQQLVYFVPLTVIEQSSFSWDFPTDDKYWRFLWLQTQTDELSSF